MAFAGYNAGRGRVAEWVAKHGDPRDPKVDAVDWVERIPFAETRNYVQRVMENLQVYCARFGASTATVEPNLHRAAPVGSRVNPVLVEATLEQAIYQQGDSASKDRLKAAQAETPRFPEAVELEHVVDEPRQLQPPASTEFIDKTSSFVDSRELFVQRQLTINDLKDYAKRTYHRAPTTDWMASASDHAAANK
jgi:hypothetical protein